MGVGALHENPVVGQSIFNSVGYVISFTVSDSCDDNTVARTLYRPAIDRDRRSTVDDAGGEAQHDRGDSEFHGKLQRGDVGLTIQLRQKVFQRIHADVDMDEFFGMTVDLFQTLFGPDVRTVLAAESGMFVTTRQFLNQHFKHGGVPLTMRIYLPDMSARRDKAVSDVIRQCHLSLIAGCKRPDFCPFPHRGIPFMTHGEIATTTKVGAF